MGVCSIEHAVKELLSIVHLFTSYILSVDIHRSDPQKGFWPFSTQNEDGSVCYIHETMWHVSPCVVPFVQMIALNLPRSFWHTVNHSLFWFHLALPVAGSYSQNMVGSKFSLYRNNSQSSVYTETIAIYTQFCGCDCLLFVILQSDCIKNVGHWSHSNSTLEQPLNIFFLLLIDEQVSSNNPDSCDTTNSEICDFWKGLC